MRAFYKKYLNKTVFAILLIVLSTFFGCEIGEDGYFTIPDEPFRLKVKGEVDGKPTEAEVYCDPTEHVTKEIYNKVIVSFISPSSLSGITVSLRSDGKATVRLKNTEEELPLYSALAEPYLALCPDKSYSSLKKTDNGTVVICENENGKLSYLFDSEGQIKSVEGEINDRKITFNVIKIYEKDK